MLANGGQAMRARKRRLINDNMARATDETIIQNEISSSRARFFGELL